MAAENPLDLADLTASPVTCAKVLGGRGTVKTAGRGLAANVPEKLDFMVSGH